jgi:hypothetical protein
MNNMLFVQVERETDPTSIVLAFHSVDQEMVLSNLPRLSAYICQCICESDWPKIFANEDYSITISAKAIPVKKGNYQISSRPIPVEIQEHTSLALSKMVKSSGKRPTSSNSSSSTYSSITSTQPSTQTTNPTASSTPSALVQSAVEQHFQQLENRLDVSSTRMDNIENLCLQLKSNTDVITQQLNQLATNLSVNYSSTSPCCSPAAKTICLSGGL